MYGLKRVGKAWAITLVMVLAATLIGSGTSLRKLRNEAESIFYQGEDQDGMGIQYDLDQLMEECYSLTVVAKRYLEDSDPMITAVLEARTALEKAKTPPRKHDAAEKLKEVSLALYEHLGNYPLNERDLKYRNGFYAEITSRFLIIDRSSYNQRAKEFNETISKFPANILRLITFVAPLELYE